MNSARGKDWGQLYSLLFVARLNEVTFKIKANLLSKSGEEKAAQIGQMW